jgi:hypothetical protein
MAAAPNVTRAVYGSSQNQVKLVVLNQNDYFELSVVAPAQEPAEHAAPTVSAGTGVGANTAATLKQGPVVAKAEHKGGNASPNAPLAAGVKGRFAAQGSTHADVLCIDWSGSMWNKEGAMPALFKLLRQVATQSLDAGHDCILLLWGNCSAYHDVTRENLAKVFEEATDENIIKAKIDSRTNAPNDFKTTSWTNGTYARLAIERLEEILDNYRKRAEPLSSLTVWFSTDGEFTVPSAGGADAHRALSEAFLRDFGQTLLNHNVPVTMVYAVAHLTCCCK